MITDMQAKRGGAFLYGCRRMEGLLLNAMQKVSVINCETAAFR